MSQCNETFDKIAHQLGGFTCRNAPAIVHLRNPLSLTNWTLPVLELMMVFGAALALWWSLRRLRRDNDPTNLALWIASIVYLLATEIPLYFPDRFGMQDRIGVVFDHNVFTIQFLYERLPLYIVALYPAVATLAFEIVRVLGVFSRRHGLTDLAGVRLRRLRAPVLLRGLRSVGAAAAVVAVEHRQPDQPSDVRVGSDDQRLHLRHARSRGADLPGDVVRGSPRRTR